MAAVTAQRSLSYTISVLNIPQFLSHFNMVCQRFSSILKKNQNKQ